MNENDKEKIQDQLYQKVENEQINEKKNRKK